MISALEVVNEKENENKAGEDAESVDTIGTKEMLVEDTLKYIFLRKKILIIFQEIFQGPIKKFTNEIQNGGK